MRRAHLTTRAGPLRASGRQSRPAARGPSTRSPAGRPRSPRSTTDRPTTRSRQARGHGRTRHRAELCRSPAWPPDARRAPHRARRRLPDAALRRLPRDPHALRPRPPPDAFPTPAGASSSAPPATAPPPSTPSTAAGIVVGDVNQSNVLVNEPGARAPDRLRLVPDHDRRRTVPLRGGRRRTSRRRSCRAQRLRDVVAHAPTTTASAWRC